MLLPDFYIIGAPKCGTTALYQYLADHPRIFMGYPKEPNYYCDDLLPVHRTRTLQQYARIFRDAPAGSVCGEASPWYLYSREAVDGILANRPDAKFIVCLRNPIDMFLSCHRQLQFAMIDNVSDPEVSWRHPGKWPALKTNSVVEPGADRPDYAGICRLGEQSQRLLAKVNASQILFVMFDDLVANTQQVYELILRFIQVPSDGRTMFPIHNQRKTHRFPRLTKILMNPPFPLNLVKRAVVSLVRLKWKNPPSIYDGVLSKRQTTTFARPEFRAELASYFSSDVRLLEALIKRDLSPWLSDKPARSPAELKR